jgi:hypothetical protein
VEEEKGEEEVDPAAPELLNKKEIAMAANGVLAVADLGTIC